MSGLTAGPGIPPILGELFAALEAYEIGAVAFVFVGLLLGVSYLLEKWGVSLHA